MTEDHSPRNFFSNALKAARKFSNVSQEDFGLISGRTYVSALERGLKQPTLNKVDELASVLGIHPLTLLALSYLDREDPSAQESLLADVSRELSMIRGSGPVDRKFE